MMSFKPDQVKLLLEPAEGIVESATATHSVRVRYAASTWKAKLYQGSHPENLAPGQHVKVVGIQGITLLIVVE